MGDACFASGALDGGGRVHGTTGTRWLGSGARTRRDVKGNLGDQPCVQLTVAVHPSGSDFFFLFFSFSFLHSEDFLPPRFVRPFRETSSLEHHGPACTYAWFSQISVVGDSSPPFFFFSLMIGLGFIPLSTAQHSTAHS